MPEVMEKAAVAKGSRRRTAPTKRTLNLMIREKKSFWASVWIPCILVVLILAAVFAKFAVYDRYVRLNAAEDELEAKKAELAAAVDSYADYDDVQAQYNRYTYTGFDRTIADRLDVMDILERLVFPVSDVTRLSMSGKTVNMTLVGMTLSEVSELVTQLEAEPLVDGVTVSTAGYNEKDAVPTATFTLLLADADKVEEE